MLMLIMRMLCNLDSKVQNATTIPSYPRHKNIMTKMDQLALNT